MSDLDIIGQLEKEIRLKNKLSELPLEGIMDNAIQGYVLDSGGRIVALNLDNLQVDNYLQTILELEALEKLSLSGNQPAIFPAKLVRLTGLDIVWNLKTETGPENRSGVSVPSGEARIRSPGERKPTC